ncbi:MAG: formyl transferase [Burkholderiaceae bacterium]|nr:formyl transferase [Burkholderiaceae bacterium]
MRFAITGCDRYLGVFEAFLAAGWEPIKLFSVPATNFLDANARMVGLAARHGIDVQLTRIGQDDLRDLQARGCEALIVASYNWRIGDWRPYLKYAVNFHPSPLPIARGPYPMVRAILDGHRSWGVSCHKLEHAFDSGDILDAEPFSLSVAECHESLNLKLQMASSRLAYRVAREFSNLWNQARPQGPGEYWPAFTVEDRTVHFSATVEAILRQLRAFGLLECYASLTVGQIYIRRAIGWVEAHQLNTGTVAHINNNTLVIAVKDGYVALLEWGPVSQPASAGVPAGATAAVGTAPGSPAAQNPPAN